MKKIIVVIVSCLFAITFISFLIGLYNHIKDDKKIVQVPLNGGELRTTYSLKSRDMKLKYKITFPLIGEYGLSCNGGDDFYGGCEGDSKYFSAEVKQNNTKTYTEAATELYNVDKEHNSTISIEYTNKCLSNAVCYKVKRRNVDTTSEEYKMFIGNVSDDEYIKVEYRVHEESIDKYIDYILSNIKISNDAIYTIGQTKEDKLIFHFTPDTNEESYAYLDLTLDGNKYKEVEYGLNTQNRTIVKTENSNNIELYFTPNTNHEKTMIFYINTPQYYIFSPYDINNNLKETYELNKINDKDVFHNKENGYYSIPIDTKVLLTIVFNSKKDESLIEDFTNIVGEYGNYKENYYPN